MQDFSNVILYELWRFFCFFYSVPFFFAIFQKPAAVVEKEVLSVKQMPAQRKCRTWLVILSNIPFPSHASPTVCSCFFCACVCELVHSYSGICFNRVIFENLGNWSEFDSRIRIKLVIQIVNFQEQSVKGTRKLTIQVKISKSVVKKGIGIKNLWI